MDKWKKQVANLSHDLKLIKSAVEKNTSLLRKVLYTPMMKVLSFVGGAAIIILVFVYRHFIIQYSGYGNIPQSLRLVLLLTVILALLAIQAVKMILLFRYKKKRPDISFLEYLQKLGGADYFFVFPFAIVIGIFFVFFFLIIGKPDYIIPATALTISVIGVSTGTHLRLTELIVFGYWYGLTGILSIPFLGVPGPNNLIWAGVIYGLGFILFGVLITLRKPEKR